MFKAYTDVLSLNKCDMLKTIRAGLPIDKNLTQNLLESVDDLFFAWDSSQCCLLVVNWRLAKLKGVNNVNYQTLLPSLPQNFQVEKILSSPEGSLIALAGTRGVSVLELPKRWGATGQFLNGKEKITCKTNNLDEYFFINNSHLELLQLRWHSGSPTDSHILALLSDNTLRLYTETALRHVWRVGPVPCAPIASPNSSVIDDKKNLSNIPSVFSLGETAVDFDIAPARVVNTSLGDPDIKSSINKSVYLQNTTDTGQRNASFHETERVEWPIVILRGNGNIYVLCAGIDTDKPQLQGPLTVTPQIGDNYGVDSCSILVIPSLPPALVIAESSGKLHHALMLECAETEEVFNEIDSSLIIHPSQWELNVLETVELELGLPDHLTKLTFNRSPIHLKRDFINELRYFAYHNTGLHVVTMNFIKELRHFIEADEPISSIQFSAPPHAEYLVCTKAEDQNKINTVLGFVLLQMPSTIVLLLGSGEIISLNVIIDPNLLTDFSLTKQIKSKSKDIAANSPIQKIMNESFITHIQNILRRTVSQPILSFDKSSNMPPDLMYVLLSQAIQILREQYFRKHEKARTEILKRVKILKLIKEQQRKEVEQLEKEKESIRNTAEHLAERYEEVYEKQRELYAKYQDLIRQANIRLPNNTVSDKEFTENVEKIHETSKKLNKQLQQSKEVMKKQQYHIEKYTAKAEHKNIELPPKHENLIKEILGSLAGEIDSQIKDIKKINNILNI